MFLGMFPFSLGCQFYWCIIVVSSFDPLCFCGIIYTFSFTSDFIGLDLLFFLEESG